MIYVFLANGFEEIEALTPVDFLRRVGCEVRTVAVGNSLNIIGSHNIIVAADILEEEIELNDDLELVVLPGGMPGAINLENSIMVNKALDFCFLNKRHIAAICAAPMVLGKKGLLECKNATCYPGFENHLSGAKVKKEKVVTDGNVTTGCGPGVAKEFSLELVRILCGEDKHKTLEDVMLCRF